MEKLAEQKQMEQPQHLGVRVRILMPLGRFEHVDPGPLVGSLMPNGVPGNMAAHIVSAIAKAAADNRRVLCVLAELLDNPHGRELLNSVQNSGLPGERDHCVAHLTGQRSSQQSTLVAQAFSCGPHGCGFVCDIEVVSDYR